MPFGAISTTQAALAAWKNVLGPQGVTTDAAVLASFSSATFKTQQGIPAVIYPQNVEQVQQCLKIATQHRVPVYPISTGKNWGYGSRVPVADGCVVMDLGAMRGILDFNEALGYVTVEPGVTQAALYKFLHERKSNLWMDATGSSPECSVLGNTLERGFGHTPYGDHFAQVSNLEVVLPNGELLETGFPRANKAVATPVYRGGLGPGLEGLFAQSNLGVVTKMTLWLMPAPDYFEAYFFSSDEESPGAIIEALRPLRMSGTLRSAVHIANDYRVLAGIQQYPWQETGGKTPLSREVMKRLRRQLGFGSWNGSGGLYGTHAQVAEARRLLKDALRGKVRRLHFLNGRLLNLAERFSHSFRMITRMDLRKTLTLVRPVYELMQGVPTPQPLASTYWRKRTPPSSNMNPDADLCGLQWLAPVAPAEGRHAENISSMAHSILLKNGFEPALSFTLLTERAMVCVIALTYDREIPGEDDRASACFQELTTALTAGGYMPYRLGIQSMDLAALNGPRAALIRALKSEFDPANILAPGRYGPA
ncbi:MAG: FAD-binding oxidoreductase [Acidobacteriota bacterium]